MSQSEPLSRDADEALLRITGLRVHRRDPAGLDHEVLSGVDLTVLPGEILGLIGETGSGKTTLGRAVVGLVRPTSGSIRFAGEEIGGLRGRARRALRRDGPIQFVFQDPLRSLDPGQRVVDIVTESLAVRAESDRAGRRTRAAEILVDVGLDPDLLDRRPGALSGGQRQRVAVARAIIARPRLLICDEPVSALDASSRGHILRLLTRLRDEQQISILIISHDLPSMTDVADRTAVLHQGKIVEVGPTRQVFARPEHAYTRVLVDASPLRLRPAGHDPARADEMGHASSPPNGGTTAQGGPAAQAEPTSVR